MLKQSELCIDSVIEFGKYKGCEVEDLIEDDPDYLAWLFENDVVEFSDELRERLEKEKIV